MAKYNEPPPKIKAIGINSKKLQSENKLFLSAERRILKFYKHRNLIVVVEGKPGPTQIRVQSSL